MASVLDTSSNVSPRDSGSLVATLVSLRQKCQATYVAVETDAAVTTTQSICTNYSGEGYGSMNQDVARNKFFQEAIKFAKSRVSKGTWLEIGCGASALLTKMAVDSGATIVAIEGNAESAAIASRLLKETNGSTPGQGRVVTGFAGANLGASETFVVVLFEIFGFIASVEGVVAALMAVRGAYHLHPCVASVPSRALTRIVPVDVDIELLARDCATIYVGRKLLLAKRYKLERDSLCAPDASGVGVFEDVDCTALLSTGVTYDQSSITSELTIVRSGFLTGLALYIVLQADCPKPRRWPDSAYGDDAGASSTTGQIDGKDADANAGSQAKRRDDVGKVLWTTSNWADEPGAVCTNWLNPILLLPSAVKVEAGKQLTLRVTTRLGDLQPSYTVTCTYDGNPCALIDLSFEDLYPDFRRKQTEGRPKHEDDQEATANGKRQKL